MRKYLKLSPAVSPGGCDLGSLTVLNLVGVLAAIVVSQV